MGLTQEVASFVATTRYRDIPHEVIQLARGFILDGLGPGADPADERQGGVRHSRNLSFSAANEGGFSERRGRPRDGL